jgi:hypothetical protein
MLIVERNWHGVAQLRMKDRLNRAKPAFLMHQSASLALLQHKFVRRWFNPAKKTFSEARRALPPCFAKDSGES